MVTWGLLSCATIFIRTPTQFYVMRFLLGLAEAGFIPGAIYYMSQWYPAARRGRAWGVFYIALASSGVIDGLVSGSILRFMTGLGGLRGWQWLILVEGIPTVLLGIYIFFRMSEDIRRVKWLSEPEKAHLTSVLAAENRDKLGHGFSGLLSNSRIWALVVIYFVYNMGLYAISFWMPTLVQKMGVTDAFTIGTLQLRFAANLKTQQRERRRLRPCFAGAYHERNLEERALDVQELHAGRLAHAARIAIDHRKKQFSTRSTRVARSTTQPSSGRRKRRARPRATLPRTSFAHNRATCTWTLCSGSITRRATPRRLSDPRTTCAGGEDGPQLRRAAGGL